MGISKLSFQDVLSNGVATLVVMRAEDLKQTIIDTVNEAKRNMENFLGIYSKFIHALGKNRKFW